VSQIQILPIPGSTLPSLPSSRDCQPTAQPVILMSSLPALPISSMSSPASQTSARYPTFDTSPIPVHAPSPSQSHPVFAYASDRERSRRNVVSEKYVVAAAAGVVEIVNRRFKELWEKRSLLFPQLRQFPQRFSAPKFALRC
jgi:hypothetical protein